MRSPGSNGIYMVTGAHNTFIKIAKVRNVAKQMSMLKHDDIVLNTAPQIESHVLSYFEGIFYSENSCEDNGLIEEVIPNIGSREDNLMLTAMPSIEEVKLPVFGKNSYGAPSPDGFSAFFYQNFLDIVSKDVFKAVSQLFSFGWLLPILNANLVVLVPKVVEVERIEQHKPIALANFKFNIIIKVLADRLARIAPHIISFNQRGFIQGRQISDCICLM